MESSSKLHKIKILDYKLIILLSKSHSLSSSLFSHMPDHQKLLSTQNVPGSPETISDKKKLLAHRRVAYRLRMRGYPVSGRHDTSED